MRKYQLHILGLAAMAAIGFTSCTGLKKMAKKEPTVVYNVTPNPCEMHGDSVAVTITVTYPPKYFAKKAVLTVTPKLGDHKFKSATLLGEKAIGTGQKINYKTGGSFTYNDKVPYTPDMLNASLVVDATGQVKSKTKDMPTHKIGEGTIVTPYLVKNDDKSIIGKDQFQRVIPRSAEGKMYFEINRSAVRANEMTGEGMTPLNDFVKMGMGKKYEFKNATVSSYASPDGELSINSNLAEERFTATQKALKAKYSDKKNPLPAAQNDAFYQKQTTAEDWPGFQEMMQKSSIKDKELILRVLTQYSDNEQREREIKNMAATYEEIAKDILPKLRRSVITMNAMEIGRSDERILQLARTSADSLSVEEILYAATLTTDINEKLTFYKSAERMYPNDWRCANNVGCIYLQQNKLQDAKSQFDKAAKLSANNPIIMNNQAIVMRWSGDRKSAKETLEKAGSAGPEVSYNLGIIDIQNGAYSDATTKFGASKSFNAALAKVLAGDLDGALTTLDASPEKEDALTYYLKAVIGARKGNQEMVINNLRSAISKDGSLKEKAKNDAEFLKLRENSEFKSLIQ